MACQDRCVDVCRPNAQSRPEDMTAENSRGMRDRWEVGTVASQGNLAAVHIPHEGCNGITPMQDRFVDVGRSKIAPDDVQDRGIVVAMPSKASASNTGEWLRMLSCSPLRLSLPTSGGS